jgi:hypothetical protein
VTYTIDQMIRDLEEIKKQHGPNLEIIDWETGYRVINVDAGPRTQIENVVRVFVDN